MWQTSRSGRLDRLVVFLAREGHHVPIGELTFEGSGRVRVGRFAYARSYLSSDRPDPIDPIGLPIRRSSFPAAEEEVPLAFHDAGPDGWGKGILVQAFPGLQLSMPEFLALGGETRTGNLAFGPTPDGPATWIPQDAPLVDLPSKDDDLEALVVAAAAVDGGNGDRHHLTRLLRQSADVGGARPKARLRHGGVDWIAKFPAWGDTFDDPRAEAACLDVAALAGLPVAEREVLSVAGRSVLLVKRFDRRKDGAPVGYLSAGTLLRQPSASYQTRKTYLDISNVARAIGVPAPEEGMFRRLLVNSYLHNTDDHLRNHAVINSGQGWRLSPVFDVVPHPTQRRHVCAPAPGIEPDWSPSLAFSSHKSFGLTRQAAERVQDEVIAAVRHLPRFLDARKLSRRDEDLLLSALPAELGLRPNAGI